MFNHMHYVPILKWKMGEYQALYHLETNVKDKVTPLIEITPISYDFANGKKAKSLDEHLEKFGKQLFTKWQSRRCFVDLVHINQHDRLANGEHPMKRILDLANVEGCNIVPVCQIDSDLAYLQCIINHHNDKGVGAVLRLQSDNFDNPNIAQTIINFVSSLKLELNDIHLVVDFGANQFSSVALSMQMVKAAINMIPTPNQWRTFTICGTSYPQTLTAINQSTLIPREEWNIYKVLIQSLASNERIPTFGDYVVAHPDLIELDMRLIKPYAKLRYTTDNGWYIIKGKAVRSVGFGQYQNICQEVVGQHFFDGSHFSYGDKYIEDCSSGNASTGNLTTWVGVSTNRHITKVVDCLSNLYASS